MNGPARPPGPKLPIVGALIMPGRDPLAIFTRFARDYGDIVQFNLSGERAFFINHPDYIRQVLVTDTAKYGKSRALERARKLLGDGLLTSDGAVHQRQRRHLQPAFHRAQIAGYADTMVEHAIRTTSRWADGATIDVSIEMMRLTLSIVGRTLFDVDVESKADRVGRALTGVLETFWLTLLPFSDLVEALPLRAVRTAVAARKDLDALIYEMVADRRRHPDAARMDLLSMLVRSESDQAGDGLSDGEIRDEALTLLLAGHETTANALMWTWYLLSQSPDVAAAVHDEVDRVLGGNRATADVTETLPCVTRVVTESLRLFPPAWSIGRRAKEPCVIGGYTIPARSLVFMSQWTMHRDARFYAEPGRFMPERWTREFRSSLPRYAYFPFGGGPRHCIGESFAWMELVLIVATIAQRWELELAPGHPVATQPLLTLRSRHGMRMTPRARVSPIGDVVSERLSSG
ncbi:MAG: cytochrome P450 [Acidobacteriota bacterium]